MIDIKQVTRKYGSKTAVDCLDLHIPRGELFACLGHNGAGKTTTIKMMVGLLQATSGTIAGASEAMCPRPLLPTSTTSAEAVSGAPRTVRGTPISLL